MNLSCIFQGTNVILHIVEILINSFNYYRFNTANVNYFRSHFKVKIVLVLLLYSIEN